MVTDFSALATMVDEIVSASCVTAAPVPGEFTHLLL